ncbi:septal ring lytic transglycosylase RlpA family protein [Marinomonas sp. 15G1-11]|uniref:Endolytic peptidoglycan transglycosylase RlpA n=1 Tax=Marinomonas phaeophyticola TaxID=3004091 RepID=A0ABT4JYG9_9GAMM|nr:septal ring lytic transglycosylase RlpA family protein [Marinomonas sp. 15G1-11]MCZ2723379.1 septal ring lytic transglycosylase RlpA family protein [Marinomonas sp. 15G1-11]
MKRLISGALAVLLSACTSTEHINNSSTKTVADYEKASGGGRYSILQDHAPTGDVKVDHLPDLVPVWEPKSRGGNKSSYKVWGKTYRVMNSAKGYTAIGTASWYGNKFHGHKTSNGETYDMYSFSAAHKSLPLPTYLKVTNLDNNKSVIVRVNDRGPFHGNRLIDLSYAAAARLDYHKKGLARVKIEAITPAKGETYAPPRVATKVPVALESNDNLSVNTAVGFTHLQLGAFSSSVSANNLKAKLIQKFDTQIKVSVKKQRDNLYKVIVGPYNSLNDLDLWSGRIEAAGFSRPIRIAFLP